MARKTVKRSPDSDDDVEMVEHNTSELPSGRRHHDYPNYPTPSSDQDSQNVIGSNLSSTTFEAAKKVSDEPRKLLSAINDIESLGIKQNLDLPKIVAIGDQSAGKSSAIAAISGITVPRASGLCTRCPTHITLRVDDQWKCIISLERKYRLKQKNEWEPLETPLITHFKDVESLDQLEGALVHAQAAILNPSVDYREYAAGKITDDAHQTEFSPNLIRLDISGPDCPELTFYDLPGVFNQTSKKEHQHLPNQIRKLVKEYINNKNHILLLACPMDADAENSSAGSMVNQNTDAKNRCVGLLTKPDRLPEGNPTNSWKSILQGESYVLKYGYFVTKQPSQKDLNAGVLYHQARIEEKDFFSQNEPWKTEFANHQDQFGTEKLQSKLSQILVGQIQGKIPSLIEKIDLDLNECKQRLHELPAPPKDARLTVVRMLGNINSRLGLFMEGELPYNAFIRRWSNLCDEFSKAIYEVRPTLMPHSMAERKARKVAMMKFETKSSPFKPINLDESDDEDEADDREEALPGQKRSGSSVTPSPTKRPRHASLQASGTPNKYALEDIREVRLDQNTSAIGSVDHRADEYIIMNTIPSWSKALEEFITETRQVLEEVVTGLIDAELHSWQRTALYRELLNDAQEFIMGTSKRVNDFGEQLIASERIKPMTLNLETKQQNDAEEIKRLRTARRTIRANLWFAEEQAKTGKKLSEQQREQQLSRDTFDNNLGPDPWDKELEIMGRVRGYYSLASANFVDIVCKMMRLLMFQQCQNKLIPGIEARFKLRDNDDAAEAKAKCEQLLEEDEARANERQFLQKEKEKYEKAKKSLENVMVG